MTVAFCIENMTTDCIKSAQHCCISRTMRTLVLVLLLLLLWFPIALITEYDAQTIKRTVGFKVLSVNLSNNRTTASEPDSPVYIF